MKSRDSNLTLEFGEPIHFNKTGFASSTESFVIVDFVVQVTQLRSEADKGPRPDGGFMEKDINSTICVPVVQLAENTSKQHFSHNRVEQIV